MLCLMMVSLFLSGTQIIIGKEHESSLSVCNCSATRWNQFSSDCLGRAGDLHFEVDSFDVFSIVNLMVLSFMKGKTSLVS